RHATLLPRERAWQDERTRQGATAMQRWWTTAGTARWTLLAALLATVLATPVGSQGVPHGNPKGGATLRAGSETAIKDLIGKEFASLDKLYKHLHAHPELSFQEEQTARVMARELKALGFEVTTGVGGHGVVGVFKNGKGPTVLVRTDTDALPVIERTGLPFA